MNWSTSASVVWVAVLCFNIPGPTLGYGFHEKSNRETPGMCNSTRFPDGFLFGVGSSSYQVEGAWNEDGKGESIIDHYVRKKPNWNQDSSNGDIACDSYHQYATDVELLKHLGVNFYRFSISWTRILPTGDPTKINQPGIDYYNKLINELLAYGIQPMVTIYHWELPQKLQDIGGWANKVIIYYFEEFCRIVFKSFGDRVKWWVVLNEPQLHSYFGYGQDSPNITVFPPGVILPGIADYLAVHHLLLSHARAYHLYKREFSSEQNGKLGIAANLFGYYPASMNPEDIEGAQRNFMFEAGWILHPILSSSGDYPPTFRERIDINSKKEGRPKSRLPFFTTDEIASLKGTLDFVGLNYYTSLLSKNEEIGPNPSFSRDRGTRIWMNPKSRIPGVNWLAFEPAGFRQVFNWIKKNYDNPPVFVTENGCDIPSGLEDELRITYHKEHLRELLKAINEDKCNIIGYTAWSLMDSFEWASGYKAKFGLYHVDFSDPKRKRTPKASVNFFKKLHETRTLDD